MKSQQRHIRGGSRDGASLVVAAVSVMGIMAMSLALFVARTRRAEEVGSSVDDRRAERLAEAGIREAMHAIAQGGTGAVGTIASPAYMGGGVFWVTATPPDADNRIRLVSTALMKSGRSVLDVVVQDNTAGAPIFRATLNSDDTLIMANDVMVDSFDSEAGTYASQATNSTDGFTHASMNGHVASNKDVELNANAHVFGNAMPGPGGSVLFNTDSFVSGSTTPASEPFSFPAVEIPVVPSLGDASVPNFGTSVIPPGNYGFNTFTTGKDSTLIIQGPATLVLDNWVSGRSSTLQIDATNGPVTIHVKNSYGHAQGFTAQPAPGSPMALAWFIHSATDITFPANSMINGAYYVPNAAVTFTNGNEFWGSAAARQITMSAQMNFHYDETLAKHWEEDDASTATPVEILAWSSGSLHTQGLGHLMSDRRDPIIVLGLDKSTLQAPAQSWDPNGAQDGAQAN